MRDLRTLRVTGWGELTSLDAQVRNDLLSKTWEERVEEGHRKPLHFTDVELTPAVGLMDVVGVWKRMYWLST